MIEKYAVNRFHSWFCSRNYNSHQFLHCFWNIFFFQITSPLGMWPGRIIIWKTSNSSRHVCIPCIKSLPKAGEQIFIKHTLTGVPKVSFDTIQNLRYIFLYSVCENTTVQARYTTVSIFWASIKRFSRMNSGLSSLEPAQHFLNAVITFLHWCSLPIHIQEIYPFHVLHNILDPTILKGFFSSSLNASENRITLLIRSINYNTFFFLD